MLTVATSWSWRLGTDHGLATDGRQAFASVVIMMVAFFESRLAGLYFMELRGEPIVLRGLFEGYCLIVCALVLGLYLTA